MQRLHLRKQELQFGEYTSCGWSSVCSKDKEKAGGFITKEYVTYCFENKFIGTNEVLERCQALVGEWRRGVTLVWDSRQVISVAIRENCFQVTKAVSVVSLTENSILGAMVCVPSAFSLWPLSFGWIWWEWPNSYDQISHRMVKRQEGRSLGSWMTLGRRPVPQP